jgi:hypothetical protein
VGWRWVGLRDVVALDQALAAGPGPCGRYENRTLGFRILVRPT